MSIDWASLPHLDFDALVEPLVWGRSTYVILRLPEALASAAAEVGTRRAEGVLEGPTTELAVNVGINRADVVTEPFLYVGRPLARRLGVRVGDVVHGSLRPVDPELVPVDDDVVAALTDAGVLGAFEARRPAQRRQLLMPIDAAATETTRRKRLTALIAELGG